MEEHIRASLRLLKVSDYRKEHFVRVVMSDERSQAVAYLVKEVEEE